MWRPQTYHTIYAGSGEYGCVFHQGDTARVLPRIASQYRGTVQLAYMDLSSPGHTYFYKQRIGDAGYRGDYHAVLTRPAEPDKKPLDMQAYLRTLRAVLTQARDFLNERGSVFVQVDYRTGAYVRVMMDEIFGLQNFVNEIIWHYHSGGSAKNHFSRKHETLLFYRKSDKAYFNREALGVARGNKQQSHLRKNVDQAGRVYWTIQSGGKLYRYYEDAKIYPSDVWSDIPQLQQRDPERTGFDSQKPLALLRRIIAACTQPGDWVLDPFAGSGTSLKAALEMDRRALGVDHSPVSRDVCLKRLLPAKDGPAVCFHVSGEASEAQPRIRIGMSEKNGQVFFHMLGYALPREVYPLRMKRMADAQLDFGEMLAQGVREYMLGDGQYDAEAPCKDIQCLDAWAVGEWKEGELYIHASGARSFKQPKLVNMLRADGLRQGSCYAIMTLDVLGQSACYILENENTL